MGAPKGNRNRAIKNKYAGRVVSLSGPKYDAAIDHLKERGIEEPSNKEVLETMTTLDWDQFGFEYRKPTPEEEAEDDRKETERSELATIRADYRWIKECEMLSIETLREIVADAPSAESDAHYWKRHRQAQIVLEAREGLIQRSDVLE